MCLHAILVATLQKWVVPQANKLKLRLPSPEPTKLSQRNQSGLGTFILEVNPS